MVDALPSKIYLFICSESCEIISNDLSILWKVCVNFVYLLQYLPYLMAFLCLTIQTCMYIPKCYVDKDLSVVLFLQQSNNHPNEPNQNTTNCVMMFFLDFRLFVSPCRYGNQYYHNANLSQTTVNFGPIPWKLPLYEIASTLALY